MILRNYIKKRLLPPVGRSNESVRERWIEEKISDIPSGKRILDAGAGTQRYKKFCKHLTYVSQDFGEYDGKGDSAGLQTGEFDYGKLDIISDISSIPEPDSSFDAIMCIEVIEHLPDPIQAIREFARLLKPSGWLILTAPFNSSTHFAPYHFSTGFNKYWYEKHLKENCIEINEISVNGNYFEHIAQEIYSIPSVANTYTKCKPKLLELMGILIIQRMLARFSLSDINSSELSCFGYHILARKC